MCVLMSDIDTTGNIGFSFVVPLPTSDVMPRVCVCSLTGSLATHSMMAKELCALYVVRVSYM